LQSKTNERRRFEIQARRLLDSDGSIEGIVGIGRDITARELNEERLQVAQRVLRHNLRNDLNAIQGWTEILRRDDEAHRDEAISRILHTTDRLMDLSEKTRTMVELNALDENVAISLPERLGEIIDAQTESSPDAEIDSAIPSDESVTILDGTQFETAVMNVLDNAITHNDTSSPWVRVSMTVVDEEVEISIEDDRPGIPPDERAVLEEGRETPLEHGSGIGLWLVHWCVRSVGGSISLQDRDPTGSNVTLSFPVQTK
jgi:signal transduction histidine kinase